MESGNVGGVSRPVHRLAALVAGGLCLCALLASTASATVGPRLNYAVQAIALAWNHPTLDPRGANDWSCKPTAAHPRPVILLHGTYSSAFGSFSAMAPAIAARGFCVFAPNYGDADTGAGHRASLNGTAAIRPSAAEIAGYVDRVLAATGAKQVDIVGYSQGSLVARAYMKYNGGANAADPSQNKVASLIGLSADNHGTTIFGLSKLQNIFGVQGLIKVSVGASAVDQLAGSFFLRQLNAGGETMPGVRYVNVGTRTDEISMPYTQTFLTPGPGASVTDLTLQTGCPIDLSDHISIPYSPRAIFETLQALDPTMPGRPPCVFRLPLF